MDVVGISPAKATQVVDNAIMFVELNSAFIHRLSMDYLPVTLEEKDTKEEKQWEQGDQKEKSFIF